MIYILILREASVLVFKSFLTGVNENQEKVCNGVYEGCHMTIH